MCGINRMRRGGGGVIIVSTPSFPVRNPGCYSFEGMPGICCWGGDPYHMFSGGTSLPVQFIYNQWIICNAGAALELSRYFETQRVESKRQPLMCLNVTWHMICNYILAQFTGAHSGDLPGWSGSRSQICPFLMAPNICCLGKMLRGRPALELL